ncbi:FAD-dependent oxidoreductase [Paracoccus sp. CPCC 101403]|uniref:FAD-dependent oxidoreductase n=1 Tax=Paracoccus broussonetiae TaxID=3075834 RepID=A0ABU3EBU6_9RHOB|nr:FAD-dependent oxidoreductase [Paracoccus sp. CPCC 101403]MDT1060965.1 FAD-dependent oxidoreductase [Paracoccus sp. CPCC 101403]
MRTDYDVAVVGGGLLGAAIAWGLGRLGQKVCVLDEGDITKRASRANFALVWVQGKGLGMPAYAGWSFGASHLWPQLAQELKDQTGHDVCYQRPGGFLIALGERELGVRSDICRRMMAQGVPDGYRMEMVNREELARLVPEIGPEVSGASYNPADGHVNSLRAYRALHEGMRLFGVDYRPGATVERVDYRGGEFSLTTATGPVTAGKVVLAAGNGNQRLAPQVGLFAPMAPTRGQILVSERTEPFLHYPFGTIRQTDEGTVMMGDSKEDFLDDRVARLPVSAVIADRARRTLPRLGRLNVVRSWSGIRVMTRDGYPVYDQSLSCPGAFVTCCHSGVTLASQHAFQIAAMIRDGALDPGRVAPFSARRFDDAPATL